MLDFACCGFLCRSQTMRTRSNQFVQSNPLPLCRVLMRSVALYSGWAIPPWCISACPAVQSSKRQNTSTYSHPSHRSHAGDVPNPLPASCTTPIRKRTRGCGSSLVSHGLWTVHNLVFLLGPARHYPVRKLSVCMEQDGPILSEEALRESRFGA